LDFPAYKNFKVVYSHIQTINNMPLKNMRNT